MTDDMKKSTLVHEKEGLIGIAMILLGAGVALLVGGAEADPILWKKMICGAVLMASGFLTLFLRGYLKLNRWAHYNLSEDNTILQRLVKWMESR